MILATARAGIARVVLPDGNRPEVQAMSGDETAGGEVLFVKTMFEALGLVVA